MWMQLDRGFKNLKVDSPVKGKPNKKIENY